MNGLQESLKSTSAQSVTVLTGIKTEKRCSKCGTINPLCEFYGDRREKDGLTSACIPCRHLALKKWRISNKERYNYHSKKNHNKNIHAHTVHTYVSHKVKTGLLQRPDRCSMCKKENVDIHAHHEDYEDRLNIIWVCRKCHKHIHKNGGILNG